MNQIVEIVVREKPDAIVIAGDIYDKAIPSAEAVEVFDRFASELAAAVPNAEIMMISGNHDSAPRVNVFRSVLEKQRIHMVGNPPQRPEDFLEKVTLRDEYGNVNFYLLPFVKPSMVKQIVGSDENGNNLSYDAERMDSEVRTVGNIDAVKADILERFDYAALGHIHKPMKVGSEVYRYCGTPLACSVSEAQQPKGIIMVEMRKKGDIKTAILPLAPLRQVRVITGNLDTVLRQGCNDYVTVVLTDKADLDVIDMQDRIRLAFPNLLEIRREVLRKADYSRKYTADEQLDPFALCCSFLSDLEDPEKELLQDVINCAWEVE